jgi:hypothetical protein
MAVTGTLHGSGVAALLQDKTPPPGDTPLLKAVVERVVDLTLGEPPGRGDAVDRPGDRRGGRHLAALGPAVWAVHELQPHRVKRFELSKDSEFAAKLQDVGCRWDLASASVHW